MKSMGPVEWTVGIEGRPPYGRAYEVERDGVALTEALFDLDPDCGATAYVDGERGMVGGTLAVEADSAEAAVALASSTFRAAAERAMGGEVAIVSVDAKTAEEADRELAEVPGHLDLVGTKEIAEMLGVTKQRVSDLARSDRFPAPVVHLAVGRIWTRPSIGHFLDEWDRRPGRPSKAANPEGDAAEEERDEGTRPVSWEYGSENSSSGDLALAFADRSWDPGGDAGEVEAGDWSGAGGMASDDPSDAAQSFLEDPRLWHLLMSRAETMETTASALIRRAERQREELQDVFEAWQGVQAGLFEPPLFGVRGERVSSPEDKRDVVSRDWVRAFTKLIGIPSSRSWIVDDVAEEVADRLASFKVRYPEGKEDDLKEHESAGIRLALNRAWKAGKQTKIGGNILASQSQFEAFLKDIEPSASTKSNAKNAHEALRAYLKGHEEFKEVLVKVLLSGSYRRNTAVRPRKKGEVTDRPDVDVLVVMDYGLNEDPGEVLDFLYRVLKPEYPEIRKQTRSVGIKSGLADMDVVPIIAPYGMEGTLYIPDRKLEQWRETNPPRHTEWTTESNNASGGRFKPLVKEFKWWRRQNPTVGRKPKGFVVECIVAENMDYNQTNHAELFVSAMESIVSRYAFSILTKQVPFISDPGVSGNSVTYGMTFDSFEGFYDKAKAHAELGRRAVEEDDPEKELGLWRKIFGPRFPAPAAAKKSQDLLSEPLAGTGALSFPDKPVEPQKRTGFA
jgi:hypothetical protein